ncbi:hypothetical protein SAMN05519103_06353 [Rhizobiales bacterium GAS113]|nr:hypothetical protein SAMN05519103_06353 [Rhizobiales bacterium GAS113]
MPQAAQAPFGEGAHDVARNRLRDGKIGLCKGELRFVIGGVDNGDEIALMHRLEVVDGNLCDVTLHASRAVSRLP